MIRPAFLLAAVAFSFVAEDVAAQQFARPGMGKSVAQKKKKRGRARPPAVPPTPVATPVATPLVTPVAAPVSAEAPVVTPAASPAASPVAVQPEAKVEAAAPVVTPATSPAEAKVETPAPAPDASAVPASATPTPAAADGDTLGSLDLESLLDSNVVSGASRTAEKADDAPATTTTVTAEDLRRYGLRTLAEALNFLSLGMYSQDPHHAVEVGARGVLLSADYGNHVLLVVDGNIMNEPYNGTAYFEQGSGIPIEMIDHIEVITGAGSVLYGSYAMLGVINVVTKGAKDAKGVHGILEMSGSPPVNSAGSAVFSADGAGGTVRIGVNAAQPFVLNGKDGEYSVGLDYYAQKGPTFGYAPQYNPNDIDGSGRCKDGTPNYGPGSFAPCVWGGRAKDSYGVQVPTLLATARWGEFTTFLKATQYTRSQPAADSFGISAGDFNSADSFERDRSIIGELKWQKILTERISAMARLYGGSYDYKIDTYSRNYDTDGGGINVPTPGDPKQGFFIQRLLGVSQWGGLELQSTYDFTDDGRYPLLVGLDNRMRRIGDGNNFLDVPTGRSYGSILNNYDRLEWLVAPYVQQRAKLNNEWQLNAGLRMDAQTDFSPALSPRFAAVWSRPDVGIVKLVFSSAFRTPTGYERFSATPGESLANPGLKPERVYTTETTYERRFGKIRALGGLFFSRFNSMVASVDSGQTADGSPGGDPMSWYANSSSITNYGFNGLVEGSTAELRYGATLTVASTKVDTPEGGRNLTLSPSYFGNIHASYEFPKPFPVLSGAIAYIGARDSNGAYVSGAGSAWRDASRAPAQVDLRITAIGDIPQIEGLKYRVMLNNSFHNRAPYIVGPQQEPDASNTLSAPNLSPVNRFTLMVGLQYDMNIF